jgi:hypothetical protein
MTELSPPAAATLEQRQLVAWLRAEMRHTTGREYRVEALRAMDVASLRELQRFVRDVQYEQTAAVNRARRQPWRWR